MFGSQVLRHVRRTMGPADARASDRQLLRQFAEERDPGAFALLVQRHGSAVLAICRRVLGHEHDAEDAFQATFLVLASKADRVAWQESIAGWLQGVAYHAASNLRASAARRRRHERQAAAWHVDRSDGSAHDLDGVLDEELARLPEKYRAPLVLCYLEGLTHEEAARQLGWPAGNMSGRLRRGRDLLRARLARRGVLLTAAVLAEQLSAPAAAVPTALAAATIQAATADALAGPAATLAQGVLQAMFIAKVKVTAALCVLALLAGGAALLTYQSLVHTDAAQAAAPASDAEHPDGPLNPEVARQIRLLIPEASASPVADWQKLFGGLGNEEAPAPRIPENQTLTMVLLDMVPPAKDDPARQDFHYLADLPSPHKVAEIIQKSTAKGHATMLHASFITDVTCRVKGQQATGTVSFRGTHYRNAFDEWRGAGELMFVGQVQFQARQIDGNWRIDEFRLPNYRIKVVRQKDGQWRQEK